MKSDYLQDINAEFCNNREHQNFIDANIKFPSTISYQIISFDNKIREKQIFLGFFGPEEAAKEKLKHYFIYK